MMDQSHSYKNKLSRRKKKYAAMLLKETGLQAISKSKVIMVCNVGLVSGLDLEKLVNIFSKFCSIQNIAMIPGKSYCFVECKTEDEAVKAHSEINGKVFCPEANGPLYLLFSTSMPQIHEIINFHNQPNGLILVQDYISETEEQLLLDLVHEDFLDASNFLKRRLVKHYGYEFNYKNNNVDRYNSTCEPIPEKYNFLIERLKNYEKLRNWVPDQMTINLYQPGQGIPLHVDTHSPFDDYILSLSIGSEIVMDFKNHSEKCSILLLRRSMLIMTEESRYAWNHGIVPRKFDIIESNQGLTTQMRNERISFTFRKIRKNAVCTCPHIEYCDSKKLQEKENSFNIDGRLASELEKLHVHQVYDEIANHFSETRHKPWPNVEQFVRTFEPGSIFIDIGCGNGKYFGINSSTFQVGCDRSNKLSQECFKRGFESLICDCLELPFRSQSADYCICIAVIHHLATEERRIHAIKEILRILRPHGQALIYVWSKNQQRDEKMSSYLKQKKKHFSDNSLNEQQYSITFDINGKKYTENQLSLPVHVNRTQFKHEDMLVPWKLKPRGMECLENVPTFLRYYHVFSEGELEKLCQQISDGKIVKSYYDQGNWCVILEKL